MLTVYMFSTMLSTCNRYYGNADSIDEHAEKAGSLKIVCVFAPRRIQTGCSSIPDGYRLAIFGLGRGRIALLM